MSNVPHTSLDRWIIRKLQELEYEQSDYPISMRNLCQIFVELLGNKMPSYQKYQMSQKKKSRDELVLPTHSYHSSSKEKILYDTCAKKRY
ncbi:hypothetical protein CEXT_542101 [Caerostris extrusa]|uniref:Uncharacterized protein n=1 Tax=Caerostris extrusa TaxID=172846 RepID=A0AAV4PG73_CAEEX|nr:hypothetical protein CEXT_542101 [Caerostris extrusa]